MTMRSGVSAGVLALTDRVLTQVEPRDALGLVGVTDSPGGGMVVSGTEALQIAEYLRGRGYRQPLLVDRQRYKGKARCSADHPLDPNWITRQRRLGLAAVLPDAGYVAEGNLNGLRHVLTAPAGIEGAVAVLALANWWLHGPGLRLLLSEVTDAQTPLALVIEHAGDPLGARRILTGVLALLGTGIPVIPLRCDISALGLIAHGALAAAFGSRSSLRHLYPIRDGGGSGGERPESALWPVGLALHYRDLLHDAIATHPEAESRWDCDCSVCGGRCLDRLDTALVTEVRAHNTASILRLRTALLDHPRQTRPGVWRSWAQRSQCEHQSVSTQAVALKTPPAILNWAHIPA